jgi:hypothetical protein
MLSLKKKIYSKEVLGQEFLYGASCLKKHMCEPQILLTLSSIPFPELCSTAIFFNEMQI